MFVCDGSFDEIFIGIFDESKCYIGFIMICKCFFLLFVLYFKMFKKERKKIFLYFIVM